MARFGWWRPCLLLAGGFILSGGPLHPRGDMAQMLGHPNWVLSHVLVTAGFVALLAGLVLYRREVALPARTARWTQWAIWAAALQLVEMVLHTASVVDHHNLVAGNPTPVLTAHLAMTVVAYPIFGVVAAGWIVATARDRSLASPWVAWLGVIGALAHGAAPVLVVTFGIMEARILFPMIMLLALWLAIAALVPLRGELRSPAGLPAPAS
jgi:cytochrome bd-type quinol oxidase subunit 2